MRAILLGAVLIPLGGCGSDAGENAAANIVEARPVPPPMLGGVNLNEAIRATGTAPRWTIDVAPGAILYTGPVVGQGTPTDFYPVTPKLSAGVATFPTQTPSGEPVVITLRAEPCGNAAAATLPLRADVTIGGRSFGGCAGPAPDDPPADPPANVTESNAL